MDMFLGQFFQAGYGESEISGIRDHEALAGSMPPGDQEMVIARPVPVPSSDMEPRKVELPALATTFAAHGIPPSSPMFAGDRSPLVPDRTSMGAGTAKTPKLMLPGKMLRFQEDTPEPSAAGNAQPTGSETPGSVISRSGSRVHFPPGLEPPPNIPNHGSSLHADGNCKPCAWFWKAGGCMNSRDCMHCHLCPKEELKARKKSKATIMRLGLVTPKPEAEERAASELLAASMLSLKLEEGIDKRADIEGSMPSDQDASTVAATSGESSDGSADSPRGACAAPLGLPLLAQAVPLVLPSSRSCMLPWKNSACLESSEFPPLQKNGGLSKKTKRDMMRLGLATPKTDLAHELRDNAFSMASC
eukprot:TRINITY_DN80341_c0_g1_i1.p1 TRINITY_DN80341_c0_g1~~TRINITY_DN80341_c0_g1_i1.p1  ORF type:complete len:360 (+),score=61.65 TRINITY_DN80341_c0_g1_i1:70-1149(+)